MKLLALDQASQISGYAIFEDGKLIQSGAFTAGDGDVGARLVTIRNKVIELIEQHNIDTIAFEDIQLQNGNVVTMKTLAEVMGVIEELAAERKLAYVIIPSVTWKASLGIKGKRRDEQKRAAQQFVLDKIGVKATQDQSDAICIGLHYLQSPSTKKQTKKEELTFNW